MKAWRSWCWLLLLLPLGLGIARLRFDAEILNLLPRHLPVAEGLQTFQRHFTRARELIITVEAASAEEAETAARTLAEVLRSQSNLVDQVVWQPGWREDPAQATELLAYLWLNQPPARFGELANRVAPANLTNTLREARERLATSFSPQDLAGGYDPYGFLRLPESVSGAVPSQDAGEEMFASGDGTFRVVYVTARPALDDYRACRAWLGDIDRVIAQARQSGQLSAQAELHYTGGPAFVAEIGGGMENDMAGSSGGTLATIGILFWLTHRRLRPLFWLLFLLLAILAVTLAVGGLLLGTINVVSMGFAAILTGLAEDFGIVIYQETRSHPELTTAGQLRRAVAPGIFWSAVTTAGAFLTLHLSALPGLGQLGSLVAIGIGVAAIMMLYIYLPPLLGLRRGADRVAGHGTGRERFLLFQPVKLLPPRIAWGMTAFLLVATGIILARNGIRFDRSPNALKPRHCQAQAALDRLKNRLGSEQEPLWVLVPGRNEAQVGQRLEEVAAGLRQAASNHLIAGFAAPTVLWPQPEHQQANRPAVTALLQERGRLREAALQAGFTTNALVVTENILNDWQRALAGTNVFWPSNAGSRWFLDKLSARTDQGLLALGLVYPATNAAVTKAFGAAWPKAWQQQGILLSGWELLGGTIFEVVVHDLPFVLIPIFLLVLASLWLAFRTFKDVLLSLGVLAFSGLLLAAAMSLLGWDWNLMNLMALPLMLGMGVDFGIHMQLALRRYGGDRRAVRQSVGRALLLAGATTVAGFASLAFSTNAGIASLGKVCALGITLALVTAVYLLPVWWRSLNAGPEDKS